MWKYRNLLSGSMLFTENIKLLHFCMEYVHCHNGKGYDKIKKNLLTYEQGVEKWYLNQKIWIIA